MRVCRGWYYNEGVLGVVLQCGCVRGGTTMRVCQGWWYYNVGVSGVVLQCRCVSDRGTECRLTLLQQLRG